MSVNIYTVEAARDRLRGLALDTHDDFHRELRRVTADEHEAICTTLEEIHRLHTVVSGQRKQLDEIESRKKQAAARPVATRSRKAMTHSTPAKSKGGKQ